MRCPHCTKLIKSAPGFKIHIALSRKCRNIRKQLEKVCARDGESDTDSCSTVSSSSSSGSDAPLLPFANPFSKFFRQNRKDRTQERPLDSRSNLDSESSDSTDPSDTKKPFVEFHPTAADTYGRGTTFIEEIRDNDQFAKERSENIYHPFLSREDWEVAAWLIGSGLSMSEIDKFLKLTIISTQKKLSFSSAQQLHKKIAELPKAPAWKAREVTVEGGTTKEPIVLFYRDGLEVFKFLFGNPIFKDLQIHVPHRIWEDDSCEVRIFDEPCSGDHVFEVQDKVNPGETLGLVMLSSDKTHLNTNYGDKYIHCVYMACGNITKDVRSKASALCWVMVGQIPVPKYCEEKEVHGVLHARLFHACMTIITETLRECARVAVEMCDADGFLRLVRTILLAHIADYPEQQLIACTSGGGPPLSMAVQKEFGSLAEKPLRTGKVTIQRIRQLVTRPGMSIRDLLRYKNASSRMQLNGAYKPYWQDWMFAEPSIFLTPEILHGWHMFFFKHVMAWARFLMTDLELDRRYAVLQPHTGFRHFRIGFSKFSKHTGREHRDLQRWFMGVIYGHPAMTPEILKAFNALLEFIYLGQYATQTTKTLAQMDKALRTFHAQKRFLSATGCRAGVQKKGKFNIKKLENLRHVTRLVKLVGSAPQFSADSTERAHIDWAKRPYEMTNKKDYGGQICRRHDRFEKARLFSFFLYHEGALDPDIHGEDAAQFFLPRLKRNAFEEDPVNVPRNSTTAFIVTSRIPYGDMQLDDVAKFFHLPKLRDALVDYFGVAPGMRSGLNAPSLLFARLDCWDKIRLQMPSGTSYHPVFDPQTVNSPPPTSGRFPSGLCNFVLVKDQPGSKVIGIRGHFVAQVRLVFQPVYAKTEPSGSIFAYIELMEPVPGATSPILRNGRVKQLKDNDIKMYKVRRALDGEGNRKGMIIDVTDIWRPVDLIPVFGIRLFFHPSFFRLAIMSEISKNPFKVPLTEPIDIKQVENSAIYNLLECEEEFRGELLTFFSGDEDKCREIKKMVEKVERLKRTLVDGTISDEDRQILLDNVNSFRGPL